MPRKLKWLVALAAGMALPALSAQVDPPGFRPKAYPLHALTGATVVPRPGTVLTNATIVIQDARIAAVGENIPIPADARVHSYAGKTVYAGFIDPYWSPSASGSALRNSSGSEPSVTEDLTSGAPRYFGVPGAGRDPGAPGPSQTTSTVNPDLRAALSYTTDQAALKVMRELGFTAGNVVPVKGIIRGQSALVQFGGEEPSKSILAADRFQHVAFDVDASATDTYPKSHMGVIALIRQSFSDARFESNASTTTSTLDSPKPFSPWIEALFPAIRKQQTVVFEPGSVLLAIRAGALATELELESITVASGQEWRRPDLLERASRSFIVPLAFPEVAKLPNDEDWDDVSLEQLRTWDWAPENPQVLKKAGKTLSFTTHGLGERKSFLKNVRLAVKRGLETNEALAALTLNPAAMLQVQDRLGTIDPGKLANLTVFESGGFLDEASRVSEIWVGGKHFKHPPAEKSSASGTNAPSKASPRESRTARSNAEDRGPMTDASPVWIQGATLWTSSPSGRIDRGDLLIADGKIKAVGPNLDPASLGISRPRIIPGAGLHVTPGLIDAHSHSMILGAVNEATLPSTAMVRIEDVVNSETVNIYHQLAGGLTTVNLLHGSANPIGGQSCVIKLRDGAGPEEMRFEGAPHGIKFALGENVKQSNWGDSKTNRFPQTRMGVQTFLANRFAAAKAYQEGRAGGKPARKDFEMEALVEILEGKRWIHCHSYRQDEILMFLRLMEGFGVRVGTLQHVLEGYKVADEIARHGAGASTFSDWWAFKFEVYDAIPFNGELMHRRGVLVSFNSDSSDQARRLNTEAAKAVKYGSVGEADSLAFVTLNPARQLGIDHRVGSLAPGKDADFAVWSASPLDTSAVCLQTWIDGRKYFDIEEDRGRRMRRIAERNTLVEKARKTASSSSGTARPSSAEAKQFFEICLEHAFDGHDRHCLDEEEGEE